MLALVLAFTVLLPPRSPGPFARDLEAYYGAGATWNAGGDPWSREIWQVQQHIPGVIAGRDELLPFVGPAPMLPLASLLARGPYVEAAVVWTALLGLALVILVAASLGLCAPAGRGAVGAAGLFAFAAGPTLSDFSLGQIALVSAAGVAGALYAFRRKSPWAIAGTFVAALQPNLALPLVAALTRPRNLAWIVAAAAAFMALTLALGGGVDGLLGYLRLLSRHADAERFVSIQHTVPVIVASLGVARPTALRVGLAIALIVAATAIAGLVIRRDRPVIAAAIAIALLPLAVPFFHEHDFVIEIIPAVVLVAVRDPRVRTPAAIGATLALVDWFGLAQRQPAQPQILALGVAVACALGAYGARNALRPRDLLPLAVFLVLIAIAIPVARAWPAPVWPDALSATFHASPGADASTVWAEEQIACGLDRDVLGWGALRALPLAGCALLAFAGLRYRRS